MTPLDAAPCRNMQQLPGAGVCGYDQPVWLGDDYEGILIAAMRYPPLLLEGGNLVVQGKVIGFTALIARGAAPDA